MDAQQREWTKQETLHTLRLWDQQELTKDEALDRLYALGWNPVQATLLLAASWTLLPVH